MEFGERLKLIRISRGLSREQLAQRTGTTIASIGYWESGAKTPNMQSLLALSKALNTTIDSLVCDTVVSGISTPLSPHIITLVQSYNQLDFYGKNLVDIVVAAEFKRVETERKRESVSARKWIPHYTSIYAAAGVNSPTFEEAEYEKLEIDASTPLGADYAIDISGDSMLPYFRNGETVFVNQNCEPKHGTVGIFCVDGAMYCKLYEQKDNGDIELVSLNPEYQGSNVKISAEGTSRIVFYGNVLTSFKQYTVCKNEQR